MRNAFAEEITALAQTDERIVLLAGDIGNRLFDRFKEACPNRFYNCGIAEANMIGLAAGLAMAGFRPVCYTIAPFLTYRCVEQIRVDLCYHHVPVILVGTGSGLAYASLGATHHSCEEMGMLRLLPHLNVVAPADSQEVRGALRASLQDPNPTYIRIGKKGEPVVHPSVPAFTLGKAIPMRGGHGQGESDEVALLSTGVMLPTALALADWLKARDIHASVHSFHTVKPLDENTLHRAFSTASVVATLEEHSVLGGLGGSLAEWKADRPELPARLLRFGTADEFLHKTCDTEEANAHFGLTPEALGPRIQQALAASLNVT
ncbi:transketolase [Verrucomicrobia bacterium LW23]|nr:transketolase [Verrucomicrobia bacterium LW23]